MFYLSLHSPISFLSYLLSTLIGHSNLIRSSTICFMILAQFVPSALTSSDDRALTIVRSIDEYLCKNYLLTCFFRQRYHESFDDDDGGDQKPTSLDLCKSLLILHSCLHHDTDTMRICSSTTVNRAKLNLNLETPKHCFTSSVYKTFFAQHLRSLVPSSTALKWPIVVLISFVIRIRACYWHRIAGNWPGMCHRFIRNLLFFAQNREKKRNGKRKSHLLRWQRHACTRHSRACQSRNGIACWETGQAAASRKLIANAFRACSSLFSPLIKLQQHCRRTRTRLC